MASNLILTVLLTFALHSITLQKDLKCLEKKTDFLTPCLIRYENSVKFLNQEVPIVHQDILCKSTATYINCVDSKLKRRHQYKEVVDQFLSSNLYKLMKQQHGECYDRQEHFANRREKRDIFECLNEYSESVSMVKEEKEHDKQDHMICKYVKSFYNCVQQLKPGHQSIDELKDPLSSSERSILDHYEECKDENSAATILHQPALTIFIGILSSIFCTK